MVKTNNLFVRLNQNCHNVQAFNGMRHQMYERVGAECVAAEERPFEWIPMLVVFKSRVRSESESTFGAISDHLVKVCAALCDRLCGHKFEAKNSN